MNQEDQIKEKFQIFGEKIWSWNLSFIFVLETLATILASTELASKSTSYSVDDYRRSAESIDPDIAPLLFSVYFMELSKLKTAALSEPDFLPINKELEHKGDSLLRDRTNCLMTQ